MIKKIAMIAAGLITAAVGGKTILDAATTKVEAKAETETADSESEYVEEEDAE